MGFVKLVSGQNFCSAKGIGMKIHMYVAFIKTKAGIDVWVSWVKITVTNKKIEKWFPVNKLSSGIQE
jgi:hypothetical protein